MIIKANEGLRIPRPESSYRYVEGDEPTEVDTSTFEKLVYWTRRVDHGEAVELKGDDADKFRADAKARAEKEEADAKTSATASPPVVQTPAPAPVTTPTPVAAPAAELEQPEANVVQPSDGSKQEA
jgi:hypothetical protein